MHLRPNAVIAILWSFVFGALLGGLIPWVGTVVFVVGSLLLFATTKAPIILLVGAWASIGSLLPGLLHPPPANPIPKSLEGIVALTQLAGESTQRITLQPKSASCVVIVAPRFPELTPGDAVRFSTLLYRPPSAGLARSLAAQHCNLRLTTKQPPKVLSSGGGTLLTNVRASLLTRLRRALPEPEASFIAGLLVGTTASFPEDFTEQLRISGTSHLVAASGSNVTILVSGLGQFLPVGREAGVAVTGLLTGSYSMLTGASASVLRGALTATIASLGKALGRPANGDILFALSAFLLTLYNPWYPSGDIGFQLSLAAMAGVLYLSAPAARLFKKLPAIIKDPLAQTLGATAATAPISLLNFGAFSVLGLLSNPPILWLIPALSGLGLLLVIAPILVVAIPTWGLAHFVVRIILSIGALPVTPLSGVVGWVVALLALLGILQLRRAK